MASTKAEPGNAGLGPQVCSHCHKSFPRLCDLNKHTKSHSRPFKCKFSNCKYREHGWPTAKELERHENDKHSTAPRTFPCEYRGCVYESKRESNCKQHMEKKHGWTYVRSKSNGKRLTSHHRPGQVTRLPSKQTIPMDDESRATSDSSEQPAVPHFGDDFVLFEGDAGPMVVGDEDEGDLSLDYQDDEDQDSQVVIPWASPETRLRKNQSMLDDFTQAYNGAPTKGLAHHDGLIDPALGHYAALSAQDYHRLDGQSMSTIDTSVKAEGPSAGNDHVSSWTGSAPGDSPSGQRNPPTGYTPHFHMPHNSSTGFAGGMVQDSQAGWSPPKLRRRGSDEDDQRPDKRVKSDPGEDFTDTNMPDIFRFAHPQIYDRDRKEKYSPCHSSHGDISTLVRHLGRPAHRLKVTKDAISSFDIEDNEYRHPRVGICRRCWRQFSERGPFEEHASNTCDKVSKGKREKWRILLDSFTPLVEPSSDRGAQGQRSLGSSRGEPELNSSRRSSFLTAGAEDSVWTTPISHAMATQSPIGNGPRPSGLLAQVPETTPVSLDDARRLERENRLLRTQLEKMENQNKVLLVRQMYQNSPSFGAPSTSDHMSMLAVRSSPFAANVSSLGPLFSRPVGSNLSFKDTSSDRDSLVQHMDSRTADAYAVVDRHGLMEEPQETLSRQNSGLSSGSKSVVYHISNSPPSLPQDELDDEDDGKVGDVRAPPREVAPIRKLPTSLPDSGYDSAHAHRNGSFGDGVFMTVPHPMRGHNRNNSSMSTIHGLPQTPINRGGNTGGIGPLPFGGINFRSDLFSAPPPAAGPGRGAHQQHQHQQHQQQQQQQQQLAVAHMTGHTNTFLAREEQQIGPHHVNNVHVEQQQPLQQQPHQQSQPHAYDPSLEFFDFESGIETGEMNFPTL